MESLRSEVRSKDTLIAELNEQLESLRGEGEKMANQLAAIKDRLNVSEVTDLGYTVEWESVLSSYSSQSAVSGWSRCCITLVTY